MWKGRDMTVCALAFLAGDFFGGFITLPPAVYIVAALCPALVAAVRRSGVSMFAALFLLGAAATQVGRMPPAQPETALLRRCREIRETVSDRLSDIISDGDELAVLKALAIGDKSGIRRDVRDEYSNSGAMHLLALSGLHVGIIYKLLGNLLFFFGGSVCMKRIRSAAIVLILWLFAMVSGMSPSISRAVLMITVYELSPLFGARRDGLTALAVSAVLIVLFNPESPRRIGFQLSFLACLALFTFFPWMRRLLNTRSVLLVYVWDTLCLAISCQLFTGPLSYLYFGTFPGYFMVTNLLSIPLVGVILYLIPAALLLSGVPVAGPLSAGLLKASIHLLNNLVATVSSL